MENIKLLKIGYEYSVFISEEETEILTGYTIEFNYKRLKQCKIHIVTNEELSIEEIKEMIWREVMGWISNGYFECNNKIKPNFYRRKS